MPFTFEFSEDAERQLSKLRAYDRGILFDAIEEQLTHQPDEPTRKRKLLRDNPLASWELRVGDWRVFYNVDREQRLVIVVAVGLKVHDRLEIEGKEFKL